MKILHNFICAPALWSGIQVARTDNTAESNRTERTQSDFSI